MNFQRGPIEGVKFLPIRKYIDERGWLIETFRQDELDSSFHPVMGYSSLTLPEVTRGPHEHVEQADFFIFMGPGNFKIWLWDNRKESDSYLNQQVLFAGQDAEHSLLIPPGVVHAYRNVSQEPAMVHNYPNRLFAGKDKQSPIDEIRHETDENTPFQCL